MSNHSVPVIAMTSTSVIKSATASRLAISLLAMAAAFTVAGCSNSQDSADDVSADALRRRQLPRMAMYCVLVPKALMRPSTIPTQMARLAASMSIWLMLSVLI